MTDLIRDIAWPVGGTPDAPIMGTVKVGWRDDAISDQECHHCWGTGRVFRYGRSLNCERGIHNSCVGHRGPWRCGCFCHPEEADG